MPMPGIEAYFLGLHALDKLVCVIKDRAPERCNS